MVRLFLGMLAGSNRPLDRGLKRLKHRLPSRQVTVPSRAERMAAFGRLLPLTTGSNRPFADIQIEALAM